MTGRAALVVCLLVALAMPAGLAAAAKKKKPKEKKEKENVTKIIQKKQFEEALLKLADDERVPVASSTLVEKGRGEDYYSVEKLFDNDKETFWAEGAKGGGWHEWVAFLLPENSTHVEIIPGAGKEQFQNFNRPKTAILDIYLVKLKRDKDTDKYKPNFKYLGRADFAFEDKPKPVRIKIPVKLPEIALAERTMYVGVIILEKIYKGQFDDTSIAEISPSSVWGEL
jgi:hypothetical protein